MFVGRDGRTADAEHQRQQRWPIYVVYGPSHGWYARFAMLAMFGASAAEVRALLISSHNVGGFGSVTIESQALPHLFIGFFALYLSGNWSEAPFPHWERLLKVTGTSSTTHSLFTTVLLPR